VAQITQPLNHERRLVPQVAQRKRQALRLPLRIGIDLALISLGFYIAHIIRYELEFPEAVSAEDYRRFADFLPALGVLAGILLLVYTVRGVYRLPRWTGFLDEALLLFSSSLLGFSALIVTVFYFRPLYFSRLIFFFAFIFVVGLLLSERLIRHGTVAWMHARGRWTDRVLVVGAGPAGERVMSALIGQRRYNLVGFVEDTPTPEDFAVATQYAVVRPDRLGATHDLPEVIRAHGIDEVIIALPTTAHDQLYWTIERCRSGRVPFTLLPDLFELSLDRVEIHSLNGLPLISTQDAGLHGQFPPSKRLFDLVAGGLGLLICGIPMAIIALLIRLDSPGPVLYGQTRIGRDGRRFTCYKFRSMYDGAHRQRDQLLKSASYTGDPVAFKMKDDPRRTRMGSWLRRTSLDELPNLFNVIRGEMSLVGPRPHVPDEVEVYEPWHRQRLAITPGMTCLWQVNGRSDLSFDEQVRFDLYYAERWSLWLDIKIILRTFPAVITRRGAY
jgi:exopolysaccharide biosynthesis polyprenyl glycosylphosphotransferase